MKSSSALLVAAVAGAARAQLGAWGQCGGNGWTGATTCVSGYICTYSNDWYSQCLPGQANTQPSNPTSTSSSTGSTPTTRTQFAGVNVAGFDFGCATDGSQVLTEVAIPNNAQLAHFVNDDKMNIFRLPAGWQFLTNSVLGGTLNAQNFAKYDSLVQACLATGAYCIVDLHNYARWNGAIVGQGGPTNAQLANLWSQLATKYASNSKIVFGVMNEPHDVPSITTWAATVQGVVTAIRNAGATTQMILLPGNNWTSAGTFVSSGSLDALKTVKNPDGTITNLIFDIHKYLDSDNSGTHAECTTNNIDGAFAPLATALRAIGRQAMLTETGGGNVASCVTYMCQQVAYLNANADVYLGYVGWSAGAFKTDYVLSLVPTQNGNSWTDTLLASSCFKR
ncbi:hypothetical protein O988_03097 [Pseudogymnoascus sp. VKM F-3808]|nr:hypothetical protein O988_03097 [Pseudogymnoascus sp. VKM F-3808]